MQPIVVDGSQGEGGGQIVRSSLSLAMVTGQPVTITNIRLGRNKPGLLRQHLTAVQAAVAITGGEVSGDVLGSLQITFHPQKPMGGSYRFAVGTAGSATLVLQTILPALMLADTPSSLVLEGGTHNPWAPPYDFLEKCYLPQLAKMGPQVQLKLVRAGFYPAGGGEFRVQIEPVSRLQPLHLSKRGKTTMQRARVVIANLAGHIAEREARLIATKTGWERRSIAVEKVSSLGPGNAVFVEQISTNVTEVFVGFGRLGTKAERVAGEAVEAWQAYTRAEVPVGPYLADQLLLPMGISAWQTRQAADGDPKYSRPNCFRTMALTEHSQTHVAILKQFLGINIAMHPEGPNSVAIELS